MISGKLSSIVNTKDDDGTKERVKLQAEFDHCAKYSSGLLIRLYCHWLRENFYLAKTISLVRGIEGDHDDILRGDSRTYSKDCVVLSGGFGPVWVNRLKKLSDIIPKEYRFATFYTKVFNGELNCDTEVIAFRDFLGKITDLDSLEAEKKRKRAERAAKKEEAKEAAKVEAQKKAAAEYAKSLAREKGDDHDDNDNEEEEEEEDEDEKQKGAEPKPGEPAKKQPSGETETRVKSRSGYPEFKAELKEFISDNRLDDSGRSDVFLDLVNAGAIIGVKFNTKILKTLYTTWNLPESVVPFVPEVGANKEIFEITKKVSTKGVILEKESSIDATAVAATESPERGRSRDNAINLDDNELFLDRSERGTILSSQRKELKLNVAHGAELGSNFTSSSMNAALTSAATSGSGGSTTPATSAPFPSSTVAASTTPAPSTASATMATPGKSKSTAKTTPSGTKRKIS